MSNLWEECQGKKYITSIDISVWRVVEDQSKSSTRKLVTTSQKHGILEAMLEATKLPLVSELTNLHYLLFTPFRYPPLEYGPRFGRNHERSILYAAHNLMTALAEVAYYRLAFNKAARRTQIKTEYTSFQIKVTTKLGLDLTVPPFDRHKDNISSPISYQHSQSVGTSMRNASIEAFHYYSARTPFPNKNTGIFSPTAFRDNSEIERSFVSWNCFSSQDTVEFSKKLSNKPPKIFKDEDFFVNGEFPDLPF